MKIKIQKLSFEEPITTTISRTEIMPKVMKKDDEISETPLNF